MDTVPLNIYFVIIFYYVILHSEDYEIPILLYNGNELHHDEFINYFMTTREKYLEKGREGSVNYKVISYFFEGMYHLAKGEKYFWKENYKLANDNFANAHKYITRFINSRARDSLFDKLARRMVYRLNGMKLLGYVLSNKKTNKKCLEDAVMHFNSESNLAKEVEEQIPAMVAFSRALFAEALLWSNNNKQGKNSFEAKKNLLKARVLLKQVRFFDTRVNKFLQQLENSISELTKNRVHEKAEKLVKKGEKFAQSGEFKKGKEFFEQATLFYDRASNLSDNSKMRRIFLANKSAVEGASFECEANSNFLGSNNLLNATQLFKKAAVQIEKAIALLSSFGDPQQNASFKSRLNFYLGMSVLIEGVNYYDSEKYEKAINLYKNSQKLLNKSNEEAKSLKSKALKKLIENALNDLKGYIDMIEVVKS